MSNTAVQPATIHLKDYQAPAFTITDVQLTFVLEEEVTTVTSVMEFKRNRLGSNQVRLNGEELELQSIQVDGIKLAPT
ncbi:hypothetical protein, partial [Sneathiella sp.]|uniref:hypothetical protein n=1 Tax=Sneathiella sp. TaxID=1964365 RepID=UPI0039E6634B